ncbi:hypothetical protein BV22DRAFT_1041710 [Leucogyrophana mollusca]|uniref:Uncharacterized protein n=1 Tax=Leucogyrophana mollusca TaxID=85980 RepID=A0ACB8AZV9_9AGAM|nr:hypothetical protein BV22DRAFT_1041710 [Leucogyrophana mollusca]
MSFGLAIHRRISAILLTLSSTPPPYNHAHSWSGRSDSASERKSRPPEVFIPISSCVAIPLPNSILYTKGRSQSIPLVELANSPPTNHHRLLKASPTSETVRVAMQKAVKAAPVLCDGTDRYWRGM